MLFGIGGARLMTRKFVSINVEVWALSMYSAIFVMMSSLGETLGPGISAFLFFIPEGKIGPTELRKHNIMSFVFFIIWALSFFLFLFFFKGYDKISDEKLRKIEYEEYLYD